MVVLACLNNKKKRIKILNLIYFPGHICDDNKCIHLKGLYIIFGCLASKNSCEGQGCGISQFLSAIWQVKNKAREILLVGEINIFI